MLYESSAGVLLIAAQGKDAEAQQDFDRLHGLPYNRDNLELLIRAAKERRMA